eukprot:TRINITY_DN40253_c0_g2_i1.p3 TRINITY_DN40253_c0_g2~~TRINITY_DN40253_c0_g2_i1.p3  ORF type:complete len:207 (+),score=-18.97 TRINITY_DN40253_c0_g2_i1:957-1577(+)
MYQRMHKKKKRKETTRCSVHSTQITHTQLQYYETVNKHVHNVQDIYIPNTSKQSDQYYYNYYYKVNGLHIFLTTVRSKLLLQSHKPPLVVRYPRHPMYAENNNTSLKQVQNNKHEQNVLHYYNYYYYYYSLFRNIVQKRGYIIQAKLFEDLFTFIQKNILSLQNYFNIFDPKNPYRLCKNIIKQMKIGQRVQPIYIFNQIVRKHPR